ncbi:unnamed protein product [Orchesella dallaii]|uniref:Uncharacterized protein n=1 Tax=Orchesella dallaii TaxID=48710 RepID=A0ABP1RI16_9HEXA
MYPNQPNQRHHLQPDYLPQNGMAGPSIFPHPQPHQPQHPQNPPPQLPQNGPTQPISGHHPLISFLNQQQQSLKTRINPPTQILHQPPHFQPPPQQLPQNSTIQPPNSQRLRNQSMNSENQPLHFQTQRIPFRRQDRDFQQSIQNVLPAEFTQRPEYNRPPRRGGPMIPNDNSYSGDRDFYERHCIITHEEHSYLSHSLLEKEEAVDALTAKLKTMEKRVSTCNLRIQTKKDKISELEAGNENQKTQIDSLQQQNIANEQHIKELQIENNELRTLKENMKTLTNLQNKTSDEKVALEEQVEVYKNILTNSSDELNNVKNQLNKETEKLTQVKSELDTSRNDLNKERQIKEKAIKDSIDCKENLTAEVTKLTDENNGLVKKVAKSELEIKNITEAKKIAELAAENDQKNQENEINKLKKTKNDLELKVGNFEKQTQSLETQCGKLEAEKEKLDLELQVAKKNSAEQKEDHLKNINKLQNENANDKKSFASTVKEYEKKIEHANATICRNNQTILQLTQELADEKAHAYQNYQFGEAMRTRANDMEAINAGLGKELVQLNVQLEEQSKKNEGLQIEIESVNKTRTLLDSQITELNVEVERKRATIESHEKKLRANGDLLQEKQQEIDKKKTVINNQKNYIESYIRKISGLKKDVAKNVKKLRAMTTQRNTELHKKEHYKSQVNDLTTQNHKLKVDLQTRKSQADNAQIAIKDKQQKIEAMEKTIRELDTKIKDLETVRKYEKEISSKKASIGRLEREKRDLDFKLVASVQDRNANKNEKAEILNSIDELELKIQAKEDEVTELYARMYREIRDKQHAIANRKFLNEQLCKEEVEDSLDECQPQGDTFTQSFRDPTAEEFPIITICNGSAPIEESTEQNFQNVFKSLPKKRICDGVGSLEETGGENNQMDCGNPPKKRICEGLATLEETAQENNQMDCGNQQMEQS